MTSLDTYTCVIDESDDGVAEVHVRAKNSSDAARIAVRRVFGPDDIRVRFLQTDLPNQIPPRLELGTAYSQPVWLREKTGFWAIIVYPVD